MCPLLGCSQGHCRVTQRAYPAQLSLLAPAETWHTWYRPAGSRGCAHQPVRQPPMGTAARGPCQPAVPSVSLPLRDRGTPEPRPWAQAGTAPRRGHGHTATRRTSWWGRGDTGFQVPPRCRGAGVAAGAWHGPEPLGTGCVAWPRCQAPSSAPSPFLGLMPRQPVGQDQLGGAGPGVNLAGVGRDQGTPLFLALHPRLPWLCLCACCLADPMPCRAMLCHATGVEVARGTHVPS